MADKKSDKDQDDQIVSTLRQLRPNDVLGRHMSGVDNAPRMRPGLESRARTPGETKDVNLPIWGATASARPAKKRAVTRSVTGKR